MSRRNRDARSSKTTACGLLTLLLLALLSVHAPACWGLASANVPLDSPVYPCLDKLAGLGVITSDMPGLRPYSRAEVARLLVEAEGNAAQKGAAVATFAADIIKRVREQVPREMSLRSEPERAPLFDANPIVSARARYVYVDGVPRSYDRPVFVRGGQSAFGFIGGNLRRESGSVLTQSGSEGTPLLENNEGVIYRRGHNGEFRWSMEGFVSDKVALLVEPLALHTPDSNRVTLQKGYVKFGGGGLELEVGRDANWFGPGYRGNTTLTNNAKNFDQIKLSSPEAVDVGWVKRYLGDFKYSIIFTRLDETGSGTNLRQPYFYAIKLALKPQPWYEAGFHFMRMEGGPSFSGKSSTLQDAIFGGGMTNTNASTAGIDLRFRIPWLRNTEVYGDYSGSDSAGFWPFVESYVAGLYLPCLTADGSNDFRFEFFYGNPKLYVDSKFPAGFVYNGMPFGHSQGGATIEFFARYSHWFSARNNLALEFFHTERGNEGRTTVGPDGSFQANGVFQAVERKNAVRAFWDLPLFGDFSLNLMYGWEVIHNFNLVGGAERTNQVVKTDLAYRY